MADPALPPELERDIFELAAVTDKSMISTLTLVSRRVNAWIGPLRNRVRLIEDVDVLDALWVRMEQRPETAAATRFLATTTTPPDSVPRLARTFPNLVDLGLWGAPVSPEDLQALHALTHLRRLSLNPCNVLPKDAGAPPALAFAPFARLTHLEIFADVEAWMVPGLAAAFPALTHLSFFDLRFPVLMKAVLHAQKTLRVFVYVYIEDPNDVDPRDPAEVARLLGVDDPRLAVVPLVDFTLDWEVGAWGGWDYWARAEDDISRRVPKKDAAVPPQ
ncbi:hypothetical protein MIND_00585200 [Mycena indigotica]|uniref:F-box domain-containing protein n=1 Tax=Mycena indigotica TaxID=2126181 RepID=A0A8H6SQG9_9AGAR|nr:uncharacterized protein MIND_00585200 [Mycena indigotica]KAF7303559.1 hypothetical protein MIND_00585200 [Mycena indigotica]